MGLDLTVVIAGRGGGGGSVVDGSGGPWVGASTGAYTVVGVVVVVVSW